MLNTYSAMESWAAKEAEQPLPRTVLDCDASAEIVAEQVKHPCTMPFAVDIPNKAEHLPLMRS